MKKFPMFNEKYYITIQKMKAGDKCAGFSFTSKTEKSRRNNKNTNNNTEIDSRLYDR